MLGGVNDRVEQARALAELLDPKVFKVNLIPYNPTGMYDGSTRKAIAAFKSVLDGARLPATVRLTRGRDIAAACGQLAADPRPRERARTQRSEAELLASVRGTRAFTGPTTPAHQQPTAQNVPRLSRLSADSCPQPNAPWTLA